MTKVERTFAPRDHDIGGLVVGRVLPFAQRRTVGPFIFLDHIGPTSMQAGQAMDVRPHPHIGLSTLTYLFEGSIFHRDNLGNAVEITPGAVNWMTAGRGIAHSERTSETARKSARRMHGLQFWVALPKEDEEIAPEFHHYDADAIPRGEGDGVRWKLVAGEAFAARSPVKAYSPLFFVDTHLDAGARLALPEVYADKAAYVIDGRIDIDGVELGARNMAVFQPRMPAEIKAAESSHVILIGGEPFPEPRHIWWNFVSSSQQRIELAKADWKEGRFARIPGDEKEFIPLPD